MRVLKGGSLSHTSVLDESIVRKKTSLEYNREYGWSRHQSQVTKLILLNHKFPEMFPPVINMGYEKGEYPLGDYAFYDIPYYQDYIDANRWLTVYNPDNKIIEKFHNNLWNCFKRLHKDNPKTIYDTYPEEYKSKWTQTSLTSSNSQPFSLYFQEEILRKWNHALLNDEFAQFCGAGHFSFTLNGKRVDGLESHLMALHKYLDNNGVIWNWCTMTHGNPTLSNILYNPKANNIIFIDPYAETVVDTKHLDYAQIFQDSHSLYSFRNTARQWIEGSDGKTFGIGTEVPKAMATFNKMFGDTLSNHYNSSALTLIDVLEATQFIRMLPFKCLSGDINGAKFFYIWACKLLGDIL